MPVRVGGGNLIPALDYCPLKELNHGLAGKFSRLHTLMVSKQIRLFGLEFSASLERIYSNISFIFMSCTSQLVQVLIPLSNQNI